MNSAEEAGIEGFKHIIPLFNKWEVFYECGDKWFRVEEEGYGKIHDLSSSETDSVKQYLEVYDRNRLSFLLPHGGGKKFINDYTNQICLLTAPTRTGKTYIGASFSCLRLIKCDPSWHTFQHHGVICPDYKGKRRLVFSSYEWTNVQEAWEEYIKLLPREVVGKYLPDWGKYPNEVGKCKPIDLKQGKVSKAVLRDGEEILFRCDKQGTGPFEGQRWDSGHHDEQRQREKFIGYLRGTSNTAGLSQCCFTLTGHVVKERPDTGSGGWIKKELFDGRYTFGKSIGRYKLDIASTPDVILSREVKAELKDQWVTQPNKNKDVDTLRKAQARYHGGWESGGGLVIEDYQPQHHNIPHSVVDFRKRIFKDATLYRAIDHGLKRPCACVWAMVFSWGDVLVFREYFEPGKSIPYHAKKLIEMSNNERKKVDDYYDFDIGESFDAYSEVHCGEVYASSVLDSRSFASPAQESDRQMGQLYNHYGLECVASKGHRNEKLVPIMEAYFALDPQRTHLMHQLFTRNYIDPDTYRVWLKARDGEIKNAPSVYFTDDLIKTPEELTSWAVGPNGAPKSENDHIAGGALKYLLAEDPVYYGSMWRDTEEERGQPAQWDTDVSQPCKNENKYTSY